MKFLLEPKQKVIIPRSPGNKVIMLSVKRGNRRLLFHLSSLQPLLSYRNRLVFLSTAKKKKKMIMKEAIIDTFCRRRLRYDPHKFQFLRLLHLVLNFSADLSQNRSVTPIKIMGNETAIYEDTLLWETIVMYVFRRVVFFEPNWQQAMCLRGYMKMSAQKSVTEKNIKPVNLIHSRGQCITWH